MHRHNARRAAPVAAFLVSAIASIFGDQAAAAPEAAVRADWESDAREMVARIESVHPKPWRHASREAVLSAALRAAEPGLPTEARRARLGAALALVGEGHTTPIDREGRQARLPLGLGDFPDGVFVTAACEGDWTVSSKGSPGGSLGPADLPGSRVASIGGLPIEELLGRASAYACAENALGVRAGSLQAAASGDSLIDLGLVRKDGRVELGLVLPDGRPATALVTPGRPAAASWRVEGTEAWRRSGQRLWTALLAGGSVAYLAYNVCDDSDPFAAVSSEFLKAAASKPVTDVIVDLRYNGGGNSWPFTSRILPTLKKLGHSKRLWVLAGGKTFSSGIIALKELKVDAKATFAGSPTTEGYTSYGEVKSFSLPRTGFSFITSSKLFALVKGAPEGQPIGPDILVEPTAADFIAGRDPVLERALSKAGTRK